MLVGVTRPSATVLTPSLESSIEGPPWAEAEALKPETTIKQRAASTAARIPDAVEAIKNPLSLRTSSASPGSRPEIKRRLVVRGERRNGLRTPRTRVRGEYATARAP
jgi:hypothetical protein